MLEREDIIYVYDGSFNGLLTAVFESLKNKEIPAQIVAEDEFVPTFYLAHRVVTEDKLAARVKREIKQTAGIRAYNAVKLGYLTGLNNREAIINEFIHMALHYGEGVTRMLADESVNRLFKAVIALKQECNKYLKLAMLEAADDFYTAVIEPKNNILPIITTYFCEKLNASSFLIFDKSHCKAAVFYKQRKYFIELDNIEAQALCQNKELFNEFCKSCIDAQAQKADKSKVSPVKFFEKGYKDNLRHLNEENNFKTIKSA